MNKYTEQTYFHIQMSAITYYQTQLCKVFFISIFIAVIKSHLMLYIFQFDTQFWYIAFLVKSLKLGWINLYNSIPFVLQVPDLQVKGTEGPPNLVDYLIVGPQAIDWHQIPDFVVGLAIGTYGSLNSRARDGDCFSK